MLSKSYLKNLIYKINGAAIEVHKALGPGLLESVYHKCMLHELSLREIKFKSEYEIPIDYKGIRIETVLRCDIVVEDILPIELKSVEKVLPIHEAQLLTYMKLLKSPEGLLLNFNVENLFYEGQKTYVNELFWDLPE